MVGLGGKWWHAYMFHFSAMGSGVAALVWGLVR